MLIALAFITGDVCPACSQMTGAEVDRIDHLEHTVKAILPFDTVDGLRLAILLISVRTGSHA